MNNMRQFESNTNMESHWKQLTGFATECKKTDALIAGKSDGLSIHDAKKRAERLTKELHDELLEFLAKAPIENISNEHLCKMSRYTDNLPLKDYEDVLDLVPTLVNLVSLSDALPLDGSPLPFDLKRIASLCRGAVFFAPRRFTAVQLAFDEPRSRILLFHTGRVVGTGCSNPTAAKLAVVRALKAISFDVGISIGIRRFSVINQVGAVSLGARLDCHAFANAHTSSSHYDPQSFVGLAWRAIDECICSEIYSTGKSNLPGSRRERQLMRSFARMAPRLLKFSTAPEKALNFPKHLRDAHEPSEVPQCEPTQSNSKRKSSSLWDEDAELLEQPTVAFDEDDFDDSLLGDYF